MKISSVKPILYDPGGGKNWLLVRVETDEGLVGWGESYTQLDRDTAIAGHIMEMERYLLGWDPFHIKHFTYSLYTDFAKKRGGMDFYAAMSGIELALWDTAGKALGVPCYQMLGGACRNKIRIYANGWYYGVKDDKEMAERAIELVEHGFTALKFDPFRQAPWRNHVDRDALEKASACVHMLRATLGPDIDLLVECHRRLSPYNAIRLSEMISECKPYWFEEPVSSRNLSALAEVRSQTSLAVVTGEDLYTKLDFRKAFECHAADIINPDICNCGGLLEMKEIGAMAEAYEVAVSPHNYNSTTMALAATVQAAALMPNFIITEYFWNFNDQGKMLSEEPLDIRDGYVHLTERPGLGLVVNEERIAERPYRQFPIRKLKRWCEEE